MGFREDLQRKIDKKQSELVAMVRTFELSKAAAEAYIQAYQDMLKSLPRESAEAKPEAVFRGGSVAKRTREMILGEERPLHILDILKGLGKGDDRGSRASLTSALGAYARRGEVFVRTAPNTFGLLELGHVADTQTVDEPPADFGRLDIEPAKAS
jgi:hypothetical protein